MFRPTLSPGVSLLVLVGVLFFARDASAQSSDVLASPDSAFAAALADFEGAPLTLDEARALALQHATAPREADAEVRAAEGELRRERGAFDPVLFADWEVRDEETPSASPFAGADVLQTREQSSSAGARLKLPIGTELQAVLEATRLETNSTFAALDPEYSTRGRLELRQPLLRGFGPSASGARSSADRSLDAAQARYADAVLTVESEVTAIYWDLYAAERNLAVQRLIVERAELFLTEAEKRADAGLVGPSEVATARVFLTEQQLALIDREERLDEVSDRLTTLVGRPANDPSGRHHPVTEPRSDVPVEEESVLLERALLHNGELRGARRDRESLEAAARSARWSAFPALDVIGSIGGNGLAGKGQPVTFGDDVLTLDSDDGYGRAIEEVLARDNPTWSVGVTLEVPIGFREGRGERDRLRAEVARAEQRVLALERSLREEVRGRHRELRHGLRRLELARTGVDASLEQVRIGQIEYENGRTTAFELVRLGADLASAQERYSNALVRTAKAAAELRRLAPSPGAIPAPLEDR